MRGFRLFVLATIVGIGACGQSDSSPSTQPKANEATRKLAGVYPDKFACESVTTLDALGGVLGGAAHQLDSAMSVPRGLPHPCNYQIDVRNGAEYWTYDIDCRDGMKKRADALFDQYRAGSTDMVETYNALADARGGIKKTDAGIAIRAPEAAAEVSVGAKALDHHGQGLIFIDDDAPCYVRVVGPDSARRLELARLIAKNLTFANAPMTPRPMP